MTSFFDENLPEITSTLAFYYLAGSNPVMKKLSKKIALLLFILFFLSSFGQNRDITLQIKPAFNKKELVLEKEKYVTEAGDTLQVDLLRFYISAIEITFDNDAVFFEKNSYHLVDASVKKSLGIQVKNVPPGIIKTVNFNIGVDSTACVSGALEGDLDPVNGMYWAWNSGYINAKLEGRSNSCKTLHHVFEFHIGGYLPAEKSVRRVTCSIKEDKNRLVLSADISCWFTGIKLAETNSIVIPGAEACKMADKYKNMFGASE